MKRTLTANPRRLTLSRETVSALDPARLRALVGGGSESCVSGCLECPPEWTWFTC